MTLRAIRKQRFVAVAQFLETVILTGNIARVNNFAYK